MRVARSLPRSGWSVGRTGLASETSLLCLRRAKRKQDHRFWSLLYRIVIDPLATYSEQMPNIPHANNRVAVGLLAEQGWRVKRAYPVYDVKRENKTVGLGLLKPLKLGRVEGRFSILN